ncbi:MAG: alanine racemase [Rickettsiales bacterium]|jgi:alanine racemase|nr:alanine racemase [Rickettsiales bacterium]
MDEFGMYDVIRVFDEGAVEHNLGKIRAATKAEIGAVVKADAYGFGLARALPVLMRLGVKSYFTQDIIEGVETADILSGSQASVHVLAGVRDGQAGEFIGRGLIPVCISLEQLEYFNDAAKGADKKPRAAIHFDTGMNRTGLSPADAGILAAEWSARTANLDIVLYASHLPGPFDASDLKSNERQLGRFEHILKILPRRPASLASSRGVMKLDSRFHFDLARVGGALFGGLAGFEPALSVYARILQVRDVAEGGRIGYSGSYRAPRGMRIAIVNIGYKDGYSRGLSHANGWRDRIRGMLRSGAGFARSYMAVAGRKCPVVGAVSMNNAAIDVSDVPEAELARCGWVEVIGARASVADFRSANGYIPVELLVGLSRGNPNAVDFSAAEFEKKSFDFS